MSPDPGLTEMEPGVGFIIIGNFLSAHGCTNPARLHLQWIGFNSLMTEANKICCMMIGALL